MQGILSLLLVIACILFFVGIYYDIKHFKTSIFNTKVATTSTIIKILGINLDIVIILLAIYINEKDIIDSILTLAQISCISLSFNIIQLLILKIKQQT